MNDAVLKQLRADVRAPLMGDKVTVDKRLKAEILQMGGHANIIEDKPGSFACEGSFGRGVANQKEATLFDAVTKKPTRWQPYKSHLVAVHSTLCWAVLGVSIRGKSVSPERFFLTAADNLLKAARIEEVNSSL